MNTVGIPTNPGLVWNASALAGPKTRCITSATGMYGSIVSCSDDDAVVIDTGIIPEGTLSGLFNLRIYWDTTLADGSYPLTLAIFEDGSLLTGGEIAIKAKSNSDVVGTRVILNFNADKEYQIQIQSTALSGGDVYLDYIRLDPLPSGMLLADELGLSSSRNEGIELVQKYSKTVTNTTGTRECTDNLYFNRTFSEAPIVLPIGDLSGIQISAVAYTTYAYVHYVHVDNYNWGATPINVKFIVIGVMYPSPSLVEI